MQEEHISTEADENPCEMKFPVPDRQIELIQQVHLIQANGDVKRFISNLRDWHETIWVTQSWLDQEAPTEHNLMPEDRKRLREFYWYGAWNPGTLRKAYKNAVRGVSKLFS